LKTGSCEKSLGAILEDGEVMCRRDWGKRLYSLIWIGTSASLVDQKLLRNSESCTECWNKPSRVRKSGKEMGVKSGNKEIE